MKKNKLTRLFVTSLASLSLISLASCGNKIVNEDEYHWTQKELPSVELDSDVKIDGVFDEERYQNLDWLNCKYETLSGEIDVSLTCSFGTNAFYLLFKVTDPVIFVSKTRSPMYNSGIELYFAVGPAPALVNYGHEIDFNPRYNITRFARQAVNNSFVEVPLKYEESILLKSKPIGSGWDSDDFSGYVMEAALPYAAFGLTSAPDYIDMNPTLLRTYNYSTTDRVWHNFAEHNKPGYGWSRPESWWQFVNTGLDIAHVRTNEYSNGNVFTSEDLSKGSNVDIYFKPNSGYKLSKALLDGSDILSKIKYDDNVRGGVYTVPSIQSDINLEVEFEPLPTDTKTISGQIVLPDGVANGAYANMEISSVTGCVKYRGNINSDGSYSIVVPTGLNELVLKETAEEYVIEAKSINVSEDANIVFTLSKTNYGPNRTIDMNTFYNVTNQVQVWNGEKAFSNMANALAAEYTIRFDGEAFDEEGNVLPDPTNGLANHMTVFDIIHHRYLGDGDKISQCTWDSTVRIQVLHWADRWVLKMFCNSPASGKSNNPYEMVLPNSYLKDLVSKDGMTLRLFFDGINAQIYVRESDGKFYRALSSDLPNTNLARIGYIDTLVDQPVSGCPWSLLKARLSLGATQSDFSDVVD